MFSAFDLLAVIVAGLALLVTWGLFLASLRRATRDHREFVLHTPRGTEATPTARRAALTLVPQTDPTPRPSEDARTASRVL